MKIRPPMTATQYSSSAVCLTLHQIARILWSKVTCLLKIPSYTMVNRGGGVRKLSPQPPSKQRSASIDYEQSQVIVGPVHPYIKRDPFSIISIEKKNWGGGYAYLKRFKFSIFNLYRHGEGLGRRTCSIFRWSAFWVVFVRIPVIQRPNSKNKLCFQTKTRENGYVFSFRKTATALIFTPVLIS